MEFQYFAKDRTILMEGHMSLSMYFILSGEILVSKLLATKEERGLVNTPVNILSSGDYFGHVGLIYNIARNATVTTQSRLTMNMLFY